MMKLAFYKGGNNPVDKIILARTNGLYAHVELLFSNGVSFSSSQWDHGTRFVTPLKLTDAWTVIDIGNLDEEKLTNWCKGELNKGYDWISLVEFFDGIPAKPEKDPNTWFCSEICVAALQTQGVFTFANPREITPEELYLLAMARAEALSYAGIYNAVQATDNVISNSLNQSPRVARGLGAIGPLTHGGW